MKPVLLCLTMLFAALLLSIGAEAAPTLADVLEQAAYQQDTANNPEKAIQLYQQVIESEKATRQMSAQALYNIGLCHTKLKHKIEADQAFGAVVSQYKNVEPYYRLANERLNPTFTPVTPRWQDGERMEYESRLKNDDEVRNYFWTTTTKVNWNGRPAWKLLNRSAGNNGLSMVIVDEKTLRPLFSRAHNPALGQSTATWTDRSISVSREDQEGTKDSTFEGVVFDGEQQYWLLRQMDMSVGSKAKYPLLPSLVTEKPSPFEIGVIGEEQVQVPAGQFNAYKLSPNGGLSNIWIDKGAERYLIKIAGPGSRMELKRILKVTPNTWRTVRSTTSGFGITIPDEWFDVNRKGDRKYFGTKKGSANSEKSVLSLPREQLVIFDDDTKLKIQIEIVDSAPLQEYDFDLSLAGRAAYGVEQLQKNMKNYAERQGTTVDRVVANLPAISTIGDYKDYNEDWVLYSTYIVRDTKGVWIACASPKKYFNETKPAMDRILNTITF